jgi:hypothetical protein
MDSVLEKMSSAQILAAIAILTVGVVFLTMILTIYRYQVRSLEDDTALRREQQQGELALRNRIVEKGGANLDELLAATHPVTDELNTDLAKRFGMLSVEAEEIESTLQLAMTADPARKQAIIGVMDELLSYEAESEAILAAVRPLCPSPSPAGC